MNALLNLVIACLLLGSLSPAVARESPVAVTIDVPDPGWSIEIASMHVKQGKLLVVCRAEHNGGINAQVISQAQAVAKTDAKHAELPREIYLLGRSWNWGEGYTVVTQEELKKLTEGSEQIYEAKKAPEDADFIGLALEKAEALADEHGLSHRVVMVDGQPRPATKDFRPERLNFTVENGKVTEVTKG